MEGLAIVLIVAVVLILFCALSIDARLKKQNANTKKIIERLDMICDSIKKQDDEGKLH